MPHLGSRFKSVPLIRMVSNKFFQKSVSDLNWTKVLVTPIIIFTLPALDPFFFDMRFQRIEKEKGLSYQLRLKKPLRKS